MDNKDLLLQTLDRMETKIDDLQKDVISLRETRAEMHGRYSTAKFMISTCGLSAIVSYFTSWVHH